MNKTFFQDRLILISLGAGALINIILWALLFGNIGFSPQPIPLHFNVVYGVDFIGQSRQIYELPLLGLVVLVMNFVLAKAVFEWERLISYFLTFGSLMVGILVLIAGLTLVALNV